MEGGKKSWGWLWWLLAFVVLAGILCTAYRASPQVMVTQEHYDRIEDGMTGWQVKALLGWSTESPIVCGTSKMTLTVWETRAVTVAVFFDSAGRVCGKDWKANENPVPVPGKR